MVALHALQDYRCQIVRGAFREALPHRSRIGKAATTQTSDLPSKYPPTALAANRPKYMRPDLVCEIAGPVVV